MNIATVELVTPRRCTLVLVRRFAGVLLVLGFAAVVTWLWHVPATSGTVDYIARYSPMRFAHGDVLALPGSAFLLGHPKMIGQTSFFVVALFLPYALVRGVGRAGVVGLAGHCVSTLAVAAVVLPGAALGWSAADKVAHMGDYGASAALAAVAGALGIVLLRRWPPVGMLVLGAIGWYFLHSLMSHGNAMHNIADVEHLIALTTGALLELWLTRRHRAPTPPLLDATRATPRNPSTPTHLSTCTPAEHVGGGPPPK